MQARGARVLVTLSLLFGALISTSGPATAVTADSAISYVSEPGDSVGVGGSATFAAADSLGLEGSSRRISFGAFRSGPEWLSGELSPPNGQRLAPGVYENATRSPFNVGSEPGVSIGISGNGCSRNHGRFVINRVFYDANDTPILLDADADQRCEFPDRPSLHVHIHIDNLAASNPPTAADDAFNVESDTTRALAVTQLLANDADPDPDDTVTSIQIATPPSHGILNSIAGDLEYTPDPAFDGYDSFAYQAVDATGLQSAPANVTLTVGTPPQDLYSYVGDADDFVSQGRSVTFTRGDSTFDLTGGPRSLLILVRGNTEYWYIRLAPSVGSDFHVGRYDGAVSEPVGTEPTLQIFGGGNSCNTVGNFTVNAIGFDADGTPNMLDADLEQHCGSPTAPALRASIRYHIPAVRPTTNTDEFAVQGKVDVPSPGVLGNDTDADPRNTLTSSLMSRPQHGSVTLAANGAFSYQPDPGFAGADRFVYRAANPFGLKSAPTIVTIHATLAPADRVWIRGVNGANTAYLIGGPITGGDVRMTTRSGVALLNGTVTLPDGLGGSARVTFTTRNGPVAGTAVGTVTVVDPLLGGTSRFRITDTRSVARHRVGGHALRTAGTVARLTFSAHDRVTPPA